MKKSLVRTASVEVPRYRFRLCSSVVLATFASIASIALMGVSAWLLSRAAEHPPVLYLSVATVGVRFFGISRGVFRYVERLVGHDLALRMQTALRLETYRNLAKTTLLGSRHGDLLSRIVADVEAIQDLLVRVWIPIASAAIVILSVSAMFSFFAVGPSVVLLISAVLAGLIIPWFAQQASWRADAATIPTRGELAQGVHEISRTACDLVAFQADERYLNQILTVAERLKALEAKSAWIRGIAAAAQIIAAASTVIGSLLLGAPLVANGQLKPVMLAVLVLTPLALHEVLNTLTLATQTHTKTQVALDRVTEVISAKPVGVGDLLPQEPVANPGISVSNLSIGWPESKVIKTGLNFQVLAGERLAIVGRSGVGKTTLAATILGLIPPMAGKVEVQGRIGYLAQDAHIFATSVAENVKIGNKDATDTEIADALTRAGLALNPERLIGEGGYSISGGEARRLALARLLVGNYQVFILDEPTEHLDADTATTLLQDIWQSTKDSPVLIITHDPEVMQQCNQIIEL